MIKNDDGTFKFETVDEFIKSVMSGDTYHTERMNLTIGYDNNHETPFRCNEYPLTSEWGYILRESFVLVKPKPIIERRYRLLRDDNNGSTSIMGNYYSEVAKRFLIAGGWYKHPTDFIDVEL